MIHKLFAPLLLFTAVVLTAGYTMQEEDLKEKRFFFGKCKVDSDCEGVEKCCSVIGTCHNKLRLNHPCNLVALHRCGCKSGLSCQPVFSIGSLNLFHRCRPIPTEEPIPTEGPGSGDIS
ncbi:uncharacterized protein LOC141894731 [Acropora palmata]|uniref:uncharacterized protein LOC141894731 n=1 Tax=Acropora palmata TaxID=6131 RepID=UPI003DA11657